MPTEMRIVTCAIPKDLDEGLKALHDRHGTPISEAIRRALRAYLKEQKVLPAPVAPAGTARASRRSHR